jgi:hypothetical protein
VVGPAPQGAIVVENRYSAFIALHDVSKSQTVTRLAPWWTDVHSPGEAFSPLANNLLHVIERRMLCFRSAE